MLNRFGDIELVPAGVNDGDHLVHIRCRWQVLGEDEEVSAQHEGGGIQRSEIALQAQRQQKSELAATVSYLVHENISQFLLHFTLYYTHIFMRILSNFKFHKTPDIPHYHVFF